MVRYVYTTKDGVSDERFCPMGTQPKFIFIWGRRANRDYGAGKMKPGDLYPRFSNAIRYTPDRAGEFAALMSAHGVTAELNAKGQARVESVEHNNAMMKVLNLKDNDACYRSYAGKH